MRFFRRKPVPQPIQEARDRIDEAEQAQEEAAQAVQKYWTEKTRLELLRAGATRAGRRLNEPR